MEEIIQRTSSQINAIDATNNNISVTKLSNCKPPLLPKPQIIRLQTGGHKIIKSNPVSPDVKSNKDVSTFFNIGKDSPVQNLLLPCKVNCVDGNIQKPANISPKPQVPPKINITNGSKCGARTGNVISPQKLGQIHGQHSLLETPPVRPSGTPQKYISKYQDEAYTEQKEETNGIDLQMNLIPSKQKSASLARNEALNWAVDVDFINDEHQLSAFCRQVEMCSKHSHLFKNDLAPPVPPQRWKRKVEELDLALNGNFLNNNSLVDNDSYAVMDDTENISCEILPLSHSVYVNGNNDTKNNYLIKDLQILSKQSSSISSNNFEAPKSFLHKYVNVNNCNQTKEQIDNSEKLEEQNINSQSFLHKNRDHNLKLSKSKSPDICKNNSSPSSADKNAIVDKNQLFKLEDSLKSDSSGSNATSFSKRFPWFGSFGKGGKKEAGKKGRCFSQFYSSSKDIETQTVLMEKNRTKSLPNIKQTRIASSVNVSVKNPGTPVTPGNSFLLRENGDDAHMSDSDEDKDSLNQVELNSDKDCNTRAYLKAKELMTSEEVFIDVLKLLNVDFRNFVQLRNFESRNSCIPTGDVNKILNHLSQLQSLNEDILDDLRKRIQNWEVCPKISDVIVKKGAFLKMYTTYIQNFESQTNYLDECVAKYPKFGKIVKEFEASERCKKLTLKHYMLKPVQRIPQYRLLLNDYLKHLDKSSVDYADTLTALKIVCEVVDHANRNLAHDDKEGRLMHFQSILGDHILIKPGRELIKDGPLEKICRKSVKDRYFILLNDCLLHTTYSKQYLKIHQELPLSGMKICCNDDQKYLHSFTVHSIKRSFILCAKSDTERKEWVEKLQNAIAEHIKRQKTFLNVKIEVNDSFKLGKEAPVWVADGKVTMCQICTAEFTALFRRHHCRGCGKVVCRNCGSNQAPLQYTNFKPDRVCDQCFELLLKEYEDSENHICDILRETLNLNDDNVRNEYLSIKAKFIKYSSASNWKKQKYIPPRLKEVSANDSQSAISGWLYRKSRKSWKLFWYVLKDHVLYMYKASEDVVASETIPVLGYEVERATVNLEDIDRKLVFSLVHPSQTPLIFRAETVISADRWIDALTAASNFDYLAI